VVFVGSGTYDNDTKADGRRTARVPSISDSRYAVLQRKLEDLEKVHEESKKAVCLSHDTLCGCTLIVDIIAPNGRRTS
jgi:hypothetical protein